MHYGSGSGISFGAESGSNLKYESQKNKNERPPFWEIMLLMTLKQDFVQIFVGQLCSLLSRY
jgi:hypothetical protein